MMVKALWLAVAAALALAAPGPANASASPADEAVGRLVDQFMQAQRDFDQARLAVLTAPDFIEISPVGDVDERERMLGFYAPNLRRPAPQLAVSDRVIHRDRDVGVVVQRLSFTAAGPGGTSRTTSLRASFVARLRGRSWQLVSAQYTPIRSAQ